MFAYLRLQESDTFLKTTGNYSRVTRKKSTKLTKSQFAPFFEHVHPYDNPFSAVSILPASVFATAGGCRSLKMTDLSTLELTNQHLVLDTGRERLEK